MHPSDPYIVLLKDNATMNATEHAQWSTDTHNKLQNERNLRGVGRIFDLPDLQAYTGSFTPEMADIIENHPDVSIHPITGLRELEDLHMLYNLLSWLTKL